jgi:DNA polymerase I
MSKTRLIIDVSNIVFRAAYANPSLTTSKGKFSGHVFGSVASLLAILRNELKGLEVEMVFCYDGSDSKKYRRTILPEYKANREVREFNPISETYQVLKLWPGIHIEQVDKEGDDGIAYAVKKLSGRPCVVFSGDRDLWSLLQCPNCRVLSPNLKRFVELSDMYEPYHVTANPERIYLAKALFGDASDGIKGIERLIKKQIEPILNAEGVVTPEDFYLKLGDTQPDFLSDKSWAKLKDGRDKVFKNYRVILPQLDFDRKSIVKVTGNFDALKQKLVEYECFSLLEQFSLIENRSLV